MRWAFWRKPAPEPEVAATPTPADLISAVRGRLGRPPWTPDDFEPAELAIWRAMSPGERQDVFRPAIADKRRALRTT